MKPADAEANNRAWHRVKTGGVDFFLLFHGDDRYDSHWEHEGKLPPVLWLVMISDLFTVSIQQARLKTLQFLHRIIALKVELVKQNIPPEVLATLEEDLRHIGVDRK
jgi:hypothetical protein